MWTIIIAFICGGIVGVWVMAACQLAGRADKEAESLQNEKDNT